MINDVTSRFIELFKKLVADKKITGNSEFAKEIGISSSMMTEILKGRSNVGIIAIQNIVLKYEVDATWLLTGKCRIDKSHAENIDGKYIIDAIRELSAENALLKNKIEQLCKHKKIS